MVITLVGCGPDEATSDNDKGLLGGGLYTVGGTLAGLDGTGLILQNNKGDDLEVTENGSFTFGTPLASGAALDVTVKQQPTSPWQKCTVTQGSGTMGSEPVTDVEVTCTTNKYTIRGQVSGLPDGASIELANGTEKVVVSSDSPLRAPKASSTKDPLTVLVTPDPVFSFPTPVASGDSYDVQVVTQPTASPYTCSVVNGAGTVKGSTVDVAVACDLVRYKISGTVTGLSDGETLVLQNNGGEEVTMSADGTFTFVNSVEFGGLYEVTVKTHPATKVCGVKDGKGAAEGPTNLEVVCVAPI
ncbi:MAG TPA: DUF4369 domain-containing protein [Labilithrix sp.]|nr:DUF4369 domain-containing protein [Labilithrix sp.]